MPAPFVDTTGACTVEDPAAARLDPRDGPPPRRPRGSHVVEALLDDELARVAGLTRDAHPLVDSAIGKRYRLLLVFYMSAFASFVGFLAAP